jgi:hypothetical protein
MRIKKLIISAIVGGVVAAGAVVTPASADINPKHYWVIVHNDGVTLMKVCRVWGKASDGWHCDPRWSPRDLWPGENTQDAFGWKDTDGVWIPGACLQLKRNQPGKNPVLASTRHYGIMWHLHARATSYNKGDHMGLYYKHTADPTC